MKRRDCLKTIVAVSATPLAVVNASEKKKRIKYINTMKFVITKEAYEQLCEIRGKVVFETICDTNGSPNNITTRFQKYLEKFGFPETVNYQFINIEEPNSLVISFVWGDLSEVDKFIEKANRGFNGIKLVSIKRSYATPEFVC